MKKLLSLATLAVAVLSLCSVAQAAVVTDNTTYSAFSGGYMPTTARVEWGFVSFSPSTTSLQITGSNSLDVSGDVTTTPTNGDYRFTLTTNTSSSTTHRQLIVGASIVEPYATQGTTTADFYGFNATYSAPIAGSGTMNITIKAYSAYNGLAFLPTDFLGESHASSTNILFSQGLTSIYFLIEWYTSGGTKTLTNFGITLADQTHTQSGGGVPEPSTLAVFGGIAALGFVAIRRKRKIAA